MHEDWIDAALPVPRTGPLEVVKERPWSFVATVPTAAATFYFKENRGDTRYEAALLRALSQWAPAHSLVPVATDAERGWSLLPDGGPTMRETEGVPDPAHWASMLTRHATLQRDLAERADDLLALGVPDQRPATLASLVDGDGGGPLDGPVAASPLWPAMDVAARGSLTAALARLAESPIPSTLQHDDLHDGNVFASGRFFDWGDAAVAHPFGVLLVAMRVAGRQFNVEPGDTLLGRLRDAYLEPWSDLASGPQLRAEVAAAVEVAKLGRSLSWRRALTTATESELAEWGDAPAGWLAELATPDN